MAAAGGNGNAPQAYLTSMRAHFPELTGLQDRDLAVLWRAGITNHQIYGRMSFDSLKSLMTRSTNGEPPPLKNLSRIAQELIADGLRKREEINFRLDEEKMRLERGQPAALSAHHAPPLGPPPPAANPQGQHHHGNDDDDMHPPPDYPPTLPASPDQHHYQQQNPEDQDPADMDDRDDEGEMDDEEEHAAEHDAKPEEDDEPDEDAPPNGRSSRRSPRLREASRQGGSRSRTNNKTTTSNKRRQCQLSREVKRLKIKREDDDDDDQDHEDEGEGGVEAGDGNGLPLVIRDDDDNQPPPHTLILGSAYVVKAREYYCDRHNYFWSVVHSCLGEEQPIVPEGRKVPVCELPYDEKLQLLKDYGFAMWECVARATKSGRKFVNKLPNDVAGLLEANDTMRVIVCNGNKAAKDLLALNIDWLVAKRADGWQISFGNERAKKVVDSSSREVREATEEDDSESDPPDRPVRRVDIVVCQSTAGRVGFDWEEVLEEWKTECFEREMADERAD
ncbi:unnamed protein product [Vitrella brassicaformis CCMP3155]|uniref:Uracil-DNA glycosylase-like domain-containing protein n=1 Tax=Vitrella brassicaformis (strain CCMP3155) TaxID=1169540 RepID=A0A0G4FDE2_VITBC|nr:unnamed protein product [Vitrella brassicaformis CCMP3155]|eukprot:CEM11242.1 unnamed protein product [Vitrella brassicaformis CCMP3155]